MTALDEGALALYCTAYARWVDAEARIEKFGPVVVNHGIPQQSPYLQIANKAMEQMMRVMGEFGMTPVSRPRAAATTKTKAADPLDELRARRQLRAAEAVTE